MRRAALGVRVGVPVCRPHLATPRNGNLARPASAAAIAEQALENTARRSTQLAGRRAPRRDGMRAWLLRFGQEHGEATWAPNSSRRDEARDAWEAEVENLTGHGAMRPRGAEARAGGRTPPTRSAGFIFCAELSSALARRAAADQRAGVSAKQDKALFERRSGHRSPRRRRWRRSGQAT